MAAVLALDPGAVITLRIYKRLSTNPAIAWANMYELAIGSEGTDDSTYDAMVANFVAFEKAIHLADVEFDRAVVSSYVPDGTPYDPATFIVKPLSGLGQRPLIQPPVSLHNCLFARREVAYGRAGKAFYRRCLYRTEVISPAGTLALEAGAGITDAFDDALAAIEPNFGNSGPPYLVMKSNILVVREITNFVPAGVRNVQYNNRYFDVP